MKAIKSVAIWHVELGMRRGSLTLMMLVEGSEPDIGGQAVAG